ncbi:MULTISPECIES: hypothetical protein [Protofrankia]|nr:MULTISPECIES: hypothetical protein [Protofrankia]
MSRPGWGETNPVNRSHCPVHGPYPGLLCPGCATLPARTPAPNGDRSR